MKIFLAFFAPILYSCIMYWIHRVNSYGIRIRQWNYFTRGEAEHHKGNNTGAPLWIHLLVAVCAAAPFLFTTTELAISAMGTAITAAIWDRGWHHVDHMTYHHRTNVNSNYGLGPGAIWDKVFGTWRRS